MVFGDAKFRDDAIGGICGSMFRNGAKGKMARNSAKKDSLLVSLAVEDNSGLMMGSIAAPAYRPMNVALH